MDFLIFNMFVFGLNCFRYVLDLADYNILSYGFGNCGHYNKIVFIM